jgi:hypothetical protein
MAHIQAIIHIPKFGNRLMEVEESKYRLKYSLFQKILRTLQQQ